MWTYGTDSAATRATLERLADWYQKGYIDQEMGTRDSTIELINSGKVGMFLSLVGIRLRHRGCIQK